MMGTHNPQCSVTNNNMCVKQLNVRPPWKFPTLRRSVRFLLPQQMAAAAAMEEEEEEEENISVTDIAFRGRADRR